MALKKSLRTDMSDLATTLQKLGRGKDTILAHITPKEAALLKARGGRGSRNPQTGLLEFDESIVDTGTFTPAPAVNYTPTLQVPQTQSQPAPQPQSNNSPGVETVTSTAQAPAAPAAPTQSFTPTIIPMQAPQLASPAPTAAAPMAAAPESVTVTGQSQQPQLAPPIISPATAGGGGGAATPQTTSNNATKSWLSNNSTLLEALGLGGLAVFGGVNNANAGQQAGALQSNLASLGQPLQTQANQQLATTLSGGLTPQNMQVLQATQAQLKDQQTRGAVSGQQAAEAISTTFANLLNTQLNQAISLLNTADAYLQQAYLQGYQANVTNQTNTTNFYTNLANLAAKALG